MTITGWNVALVGCGKMGSALIRGAVDADAIDPQRLYCIDAHGPAAQTLSEDVGGHVGAPPVGEPALWVIAVKPHDVRAAIEELDVTAGDVLLSAAAGVTLTALQTAAPDARIVRSMPNTPALVQSGITGIYSQDEDALGLAETLFASVGEVVRLSSESQFDAVTAVSGSGPAYVFVAIEALADGGVLMGLDRATATKLAIHTVLGGAALAHSEPTHVAELKDRVASPGGTTIAGLAALEKAGFRTALISAVKAAAKRSRELGEE